MPRVGMNPARGQPSGYQPARITLAMLTYLPNQAGYFEQRFAVTRLSLESLIASTPEPHDPAADRYRSRGGRCSASTLTGARQEALA